jgi:hypothetical protein
VNMSGITGRGSEHPKLELTWLTPQSNYYHRLLAFQLLYSRLNVLVKPCLVRSVAERKHLAFLPSFFAPPTAQRETSTQNI